MSAVLLQGGRPLWLLGDLHGRWARLSRALQAAGLIDASGRARLPAGALLVQVGDVVDHGPDREAPPALELAARQEELRGAGPAPDPRAASRQVEPLALLRGPRGWPEALREEEQRALLGALDALRTLRLLRRLEAEAAADGARVVVLLGNHDLDLLRGRPAWCAREKAWLLALLGLEPAAVREHLARGLPEQVVTGAAPELAWLAARPLLWAGEGGVALHGGPPRGWLDQLAGAGVQDLPGLVSWLEAVRAAGLGHPALDEGRSFLSPDGPQDDLAHDPRLVPRFLALCGASWLAVGHSPFLHAPRGRWQDLRDPRLRAPCERPARLGPGGALLKLDTNLKRGGPAWLVSRGESGWEALDEAGARHVLPIEGASPPSEPGITPAGLRALEAALEAAPPGVAAAVRAARGPLLALGLQDLAPLRAAAAAAAPEAPAVRYLELLRAAAAERAAGTVGQAREVDGWPFLAAPAGPAAPRAAAATGPAGSAARSAAPRAEPPPAPATPDPPDPPGPELRALAERWLERHAPLLGAPAAAWQLRSAGPRRLALLPPAGPPWTLVQLPGGALCPANLGLHDPGLALDSEPPGDRPLGERLLEAVAGDPLPLASAVTPAQAALLLLGELDRLGPVAEEGALARPPAFQRRRTLFATPHPAAARAFAWKGALLRFAPPRAQLQDALASGLLAVGLFVADPAPDSVADGGEPLDPEARFGAPDVGLEVVALDAPGIAWLLRWRVPDQNQT